MELLLEEIMEYTRSLQVAVQLAPCRPPFKLGPMSQSYPEAANSLPWDPKAPKCPPSRGLTLLNSVLV